MTATCPTSIRLHLGPVDLRHMTTGEADAWRLGAAWGQRQGVADPALARWLTHSGGQRLDLATLTPDQALDDARRIGLPQLVGAAQLLGQQGHARDNEELERGVRCIAAGVFDDQSRLIAGLSISAPTERMDDSWIPHLIATAKEISTALGCTDIPMGTPPDLG